MSRLVSLLPVGALLFLSCWAASAGLHVGRRSPREQLDSVVSIAVRCSNYADGKGSTASGVIVSPTQVLTAAHVVGCQVPGQEASGEVLEAYAFEVGGFGHPVVVEEIDEEHDLARMVIADDAEFYHPPAVRFGSPEEQHLACVVTGFPHRSRRCGTFDLVGPGANGLWFSVVIEGGNSGSPIYNEDGELAGIVTMRSTLADGQNVTGMGSAVSSPSF